ncbi:right-handed parallel beta-helix repeat-containing protein [Rubrobacter taiwanensis]|nr:right-handed parallel beta-helix repeat-containing protein [Rubrobacter taiwanensis]
MRRPLTRSSGGFVSVLVAVVAVCVAAFSSGDAGAREKANAAGCVGRDVYPGQDLAAIAASMPAGTTYCIHDGRYDIVEPIKAKSGDTFWGVYSDSTRPIIRTDSAEYIIYTRGANGVTVRNLTVKGAVGGHYCKPDCGRGIGGGGRDLHIINVRATGNANQGVGGAGPGLVIRNSRLDHNGSPPFTRVEGGAVSAAGVKSVNSFKVINSRIDNNLWVGVWCDIECGDGGASGTAQFVVRGSTITDNGKAGIHYEISSGPAIVVNNTIQRNGWWERANRHTGLLVVASENLLARNNRFGGNVKYGFEAVSDHRGELKNITFRDNFLNGDALKGCRAPVVRCRANG